MLNPDTTVIFLDVDDTLLDNDRFGTDLGAHLEHTLGAAQRDRYWEIFTRLRTELGYADYLTALQRLRSGLEDDPALLRMSEFMLEYPFRERLYPFALEALAHLRTLGLTAVLSDGDVVFQPRKIQRAGLWGAVDGRVQICVHKERELPAAQRRFPAAHYVVIDDKPNILAAIKTALGSAVTTVFVRQGHYANAPGAADVSPGPDHSIAGIGDLFNWRSADF
jgi:FMN phosphatase YigB (HAD superfamily)